MFEGILQPGHLLLILGIALLMFGPQKLPQLGKGLGEAIRGFKEGLTLPANKASDVSTKPPQSLPAAENEVGSGPSL
jgi:sec-independent protein translocase protein TatA